MDIDLGEKEVANIKMGAESYTVQLPTVRDAQWLSKNTEEGKEVDIFIEFVTKLGLPSKIAENLTLKQLTMLSEGLMGTSKKK